MRLSYRAGVRIRDLTWLVAVAEQGHVTDAAARLGVPQPTVSRALARVESEIGAPLLTRTPTGVVLNPLGELVVAAARDLTERYRRLTDDVARALNPDSGVVRLAFLDSMATTLVPRLLRDFHAEAPGVRIELRQEPGHEIEADLLTGAADVAVTSGATAGPADDWIPLQHDRLTLIVPPSHPLRTRRSVALAELADVGFVCVLPGFGYRILTDRLLADAGVAPPVTFESADLATIEGLVAAGLGVAIVPQAFVGLSGSVGVRLTDHGAARDIGLTWRTDRALTPAASRFVAFVARRTPGLAPAADATPHPDGG